MKKIIPIFLLIILITISLLCGKKVDKDLYTVFEEPTNGKQTIAVYIEGELATDFPNTSGYSATVECTSNGVAVNGVTGSAHWNGTKWLVSVSNIENGNVKCNVYFVEAEYAIGNQITLSLNGSPSSSSWKTSTDGYDAIGREYLVSNTYTNSGTNATFTNDITDWYIWDYYNDHLTLISAEPTTVELKLNYSKGYNNALFFINNIPELLYADTGVIARSINMTDILSKIFEYKQEITISGSPVSLVDANNRALTNIITSNDTQLANIIQTLFDPTYGSGFSYSSANRYFPRTLYDTINSYTIDFSTATDLRNLDNQVIIVPSSYETQRLTTLKPLKWSYSITSFTNMIDSTTLSMLESSSDYWIATRDYNFTDANNASVAFGVKVWTNNTIVPRAIYTSNITTGQAVLSASIRPIVEIDLTQVEIKNGGVSLIL